MLTFFIYSLAAPWLTLGHYRGDSVTHPNYSLRFFKFRPKGHWGPRNEVGSLNPTEHLVEFEPETFLFI